MRVLRNCLFSLKTIFHYVPLNGIAAAFCFFVPGAFAGLRVLLVQKIVDSAVSCVREPLPAGAGGMESLALWGILLVLMLTLENSMHMVGNYQMELVGVKLMDKMAPDIAKRLMNLEYAAFEEKQTQELFQKMSGSPETGIYDCSLSTMYVIQKTISLVSSMSVIFAISPWIGLGIVVIGIPMLLIGYCAAGYNMNVNEEGADVRRRMWDLKGLLNDKSAMFERKLFDAEELFERKWEDYSTKYADIVMRENRKVMWMDIASRLLTVVYLLFVVCMATVGFMGESMTLGQFTGALSAVAGIGKNLNDGSRHVGWLMYNAMAIDYYMDFLKLGTRTDLGEVEALSRYDIAFENVSFRYPGTGRDILKNVTFYIKEGERIAFVGENGAGKSTIIKLLCGLYEPTTGNVTIGGVPVRALSPELRTSMLSAVFQDFKTYQMTLRENVALGNISSLADDGRLLQALRMADAGELAFSQEKGLDRNLGKLTEDGQDLSGGQWQRVAMARAFVSDAKYVVLDEPVAALDPLAESHMYENFSRIFNSRGTILISHRLASAKLADRILVLDGGRIVQTGSHEELMGKQGLYRTMFLAQSSFYRDGQEQGG